MCLFCDIADHKIPCQKAYEDDLILAFHDMHPQAPTHLLIIPKQHKDNILSFEAQDAKLLLALFKGIQEVVQLFKLNEGGFRVVTNTGEQAGQSVGHLHFHILGGRTMNWPPG